MLEVVPDIGFKEAVKRGSGASLNVCIQCGTCSVVCSLAPEERPFPRKEMMWAAWGLPEKLLANPDLWLCHQCGDCSAHCPRDARPADVLSAVRQFSYLHYARPSFLGKLVNDPLWLPVAILIPVIIIAVILLMAGTLTIPDGPVDYSAFFPHAWLNGSFTLLTFFFYGMAAVGFARFWQDLSAAFPGRDSRKGFWKGLWHVAGEVFFHRKFGECVTQRSRKPAHLLVFSGFSMLLLVTLYAIFAAITHNYPLTLYNPFKIAGNVAALMLLTGLGIMLINRIKSNRIQKVGVNRFNPFNAAVDGIGRKIHGGSLHSTYSDWLFLVSLFLLTVSGILVQAARFQDWGLAYHFYFFHLVCVWFVIMYLPYSKFAHVVYRVMVLGKVKV